MKAVFGAGEIAPSEPEHDQKKPPTAFLILAAFFIFAGLYVTLGLHSPPPERCVAIFQNIATLFFLLCIFQLGRAATQLPSANPRASIRALILPLALGALVWAGSISTHFISDDFEHLRAMASPLKKIAWDNFVLGQAHTFIRPIGFLSLAVDYRLFHFWAPGYHIVSLLLHLAAVAGLFFLCRELGLSRSMCAMAALFFSVLPLNEEAIVWMACRFDQIATPLMIWSVFAYTRFRTTGNKGLLVLALVFFVVAVFSKESAYALPGIVLLLEAAVLRPRRWLPVTAFFVLAAACFLYRWFVLGGIGGYREASGANSALHINVNTFKGLFLRAPAETLFGFNWFQPPKLGTLLIASAFAALLLSLCIFPPRESRRLSWFAIGWILIAPIPAHSLARVGADLVNSRELYFASAGTAILLALLVNNILQTHMRMTAYLLMALLFALGAWHNLAAWRFDSAMSRWLPTKLMALYPQPPTGTEFQINGLPRSFRGIYFYQTGLNAAVQLAYRRNDIVARRSSDPENSVAHPKTVVKLCFVSTPNEEGELVLCPTAYKPALSP